jgi:hypothetical protein
MDTDSLLIGTFPSQVLDQTFFWPRARAHCSRLQCFNDNLLISGGTITSATRLASCVPSILPLPVIRIDCVSCNRRSMASNRRDMTVWVKEHLFSSGSQGRNFEASAI